MSKMKEFVAFRAAISLLKENGLESILDSTYEKCKAALADLTGNQKNYVQEMYNTFSYEQVSKKIAEIVTPAKCQAEIEVVFQTVDHLHDACPKHLGDWYFTGDYPTPGGNRVSNKAFVYFMEGKTVRAY